MVDTGASFEDMRKSSAWAGQLRTFFCIPLCCVPVLPYKKRSKKREDSGNNNKRSTWQNEPNTLALKIGRIWIMDGNV